MASLHRTPEFKALKRCSEQARSTLQGSHPQILQAAQACWQRQQLIVAQQQALQTAKGQHIIWDVCQAVVGCINLTGTRTSFPHALWKLLRAFGVWSVPKLVGLRQGTCGLSKVGSKSHPKIRIPEPYRSCGCPVTDTLGCIFAHLVGLKALGGSALVSRAARAHLCSEAELHQHLTKASALLWCTGAAKGLKGATLLAHSLKTHRPEVRKLSTRLPSAVLSRSAQSPDFKRRAPARHCGKPQK